MIVPPLKPVLDGQILTKDLINHIIKRTEYGAELLRQYRALAGNNIFVEQGENGLVISYLNAIAGGAGTGSGGQGTGQSGQGIGQGGAGIGAGGAGIINPPQPQPSGIIPDHIGSVLLEPEQYVSYIYENGQFKIIKYPFNYAFTNLFKISRNRKNNSGSIQETTSGVPVAYFYKNGQFLDLIPPNNRVFFPSNNWGIPTNNGIWRSMDNGIYFSENGTTWTNYYDGLELMPFPYGFDPGSSRGMAIKVTAESISFYEIYEESVNQYYQTSRLPYPSGTVLLSTLTDGYSLTQLGVLADYIAPPFPPQTNLINFRAIIKSESGIRNINNFPISEVPFNFNPQVAIFKNGHFIISYPIFGTEIYYLYNYDTNGFYDITDLYSQALGGGTINIDRSGKVFFGTKNENCVKIYNIPYLSEDKQVNFPDSFNITQIQIIVPSENDTFFISFDSLGTLKSYYYNGTSFIEISSEQLGGEPFIISILPPIS